MDTTTTTVSGAACHAAARLERLDHQAGSPDPHDDIECVCGEWIASRDFARHNSTCKEWGELCDAAEK